ncbi:MAG: sensor domain-containing diguanylate cyclase [Sporolactobacillus sp.]
MKMNKLDTVLLSVLSCINEGIVIVTTDLTVQYWNPFMEQLTGYSHAIGHNIQDVMPHLNQPFFSEAFERVIRHRTSAFFSAATHQLTDDSVQKINLKMNAIADETGVVVLLEFIDVTNQFLRIDQLREAVKQLSMLNQEMRRKERIIERLAYYDRLTGVASRAFFEKCAERLMGDARKYNKHLGLMFVDVNEFKAINDTYGHHIGDKVMAQIASMLANAVRKDDVVCRYGGDEFLILLPDIGSKENYWDIRKRLQNEMNQPIVQHNIEVKVSLSIGVSFFPEDGQTIEQLIIKADQFMYASKQQFHLK